MRKAYKIIIVNLGLAISLALIFAAGGSLNGSFFMNVFGALYGISVVAGIVDLVVGLVFSANKSIEKASGFLISGLLFLCIGFIVFTFS